MEIYHVNDRNKYRLNKDLMDIFKGMTVQEYLDQANDILHPHYKDIKSENTINKYGIVIFELWQNGFDISSSRGGPAYGAWMILMELFPVRIPVKIKISTKDPNSILDIKEVLYKDEFPSISKFKKMTFEEILEVHLRGSNPDEKFRKKMSELGLWKDS